MEQKQLDEIDESYFGEEFVEDEQPVKEKSKKASTKSTKSKKTEKKTKKTTTKKTTKSDKKVAEKKEDKNEEISITPVKEEVKVEKEEKSELSSPITSSSAPVDPWAGNEEESSGFGVGAWKAITGILLILLIFSVFTDGFNFAEGTSSGKTLLLSEAEDKTLNFVNENLLKPPFLAEIISSADENGLYKITISVAGQEVDSYLTKDGKMFFPQGFDTSLDLNALTDQQNLQVEDNIAVEQLEESAEDELAEIEVLLDETVGDVEELVEVVEEDSMEEEVTVQPGEESGLVIEEVAEETEEESDLVAEEQNSGSASVRTVSLYAKKWSFSPDVVSVNKGDIVKFNIMPDISKPAFLISDFTFAIPDLGIEQQVSGTTEVEAVADQIGSFTFTCSSCEEWRGMTGTLVVK